MDESRQPDDIDSSHARPYYNLLRLYFVLCFAKYILLMQCAALPPASSLLNK